MLYAEAKVHEHEIIQTGSIVSGRKHGARKQSKYGTATRVGRSLLDV